MIANLTTKSTRRKRKKLEKWVNPVSLRQIVTKLSSAHRAILSRLMHAGYSYTHIYLSQETIANDIGLCRETVNRLIGILINLGLLQTIYRHKQTCLYYLHPALLALPITLLTAGLTEYVTVLRNKDIYIKQYPDISVYPAVKGGAGCQLLDGCDGNQVQKRSKMRIILSTVLKNVQLHDADIEELETVPDQLIHTVLKKLLTKRDQPRDKRAWFMAVIRSEQLQEKDGNKATQSVFADKKTAQKKEHAKPNPQAINDRWQADNERQRQFKLTKFNSFSPSRQQALLADYTKDPDWPISWGCPSLLFKDQPKPFSHKQQQGSRITQLKAELDEELATLAKVSTNKNVMIANGHSQLANTLCNPVIAMAQNKAIMLEAQIKELVKEEELWNHLEPVK